MDAKEQARIEKQRARRAYLDSRIPELHRKGVKGRTARVQADLEFARR